MRVSHQLPPASCLLTSDFCEHMGNPLDAVPLSGIFSIRDMMSTVDRPFRLDHGDISFDTPAPIREAMKRALDAGETHYVQTGGLPRLRALLADKLRDRNAIPVDDPDEVLVTAGGMHGLYLIARTVLDPGDEIIVPDPVWGPFFSRRIAADLGRESLAMISLSSPQWRGWWSNPSGQAPSGFHLWSLPARSRHR